MGDNAEMHYQLCFKIQRQYIIGQKQYVKFKTTDTPQDVWYAVYKVISDYIEVDSDVTRTSEDISAFDNPDYILSGNSQSEIDHAHHESMNEEELMFY